MTIDRRAFFERTAAGLALSSLAGAAANDTLFAADDPSLRIDLTGLFAMELWTAVDARRALVACVDGAKTVAVPHAPLLIANLEDCVMPGHKDFPEDPQERYRPPQVVRLGETTCGVWSLADHALWVDHRGKDKTYPTDGYGNFDFPLRTGKVTNGPMPLDRDDGWAGREWFLDMCNIRNTEVGPLKADLITAKILLRYGAAAGRAPKSRCEQERRYRFKDEPESKLRAVGAEIRVEHPGNLDKPYTDFRIVHLEGPDRVPSGEIGAIIRLRTSQGRATPVALVNIPIFAYMVKPPGKDHKGATEEDRKCEHDHFKAYFDLVGAAANRRCLLWKEAEGCQDPIGFRNPSEAGCVPCVICRS